jgi:hypothetical protein
VDRVVAVGDVHGSFEQFTAVLRQAGVIDEKNRWSGGKTHLVQLGDVPDRAPDTRRVLELLMDLEKQARKAGGMVHPLIGNHEAMNIYGDLRYVTPEEFASFKTPSSEEVRERFWEMHAEEMNSKGAAGGLTPAYKKEWQAQNPLGFFEHRFEFGVNGKYGKWIRKHDAVILINDTLFLHGGISPKYATWSLSDLNKQIRKELSDFTHIPNGVAIDPEGPLWYRGLALAPEAEIEAHVTALLQLHGAKRIVLGHTPTQGVPVSRLNGRVILADVGLGVAYGGRLACVILENGELLALSGGKTHPIQPGPVQTAAIGN